MTLLWAARLVMAVAVIVFWDLHVLVQLVIVAQAFVEAFGLFSWFRLKHYQRIGRELDAQLRDLRAVDV